MKLTKKYDDNSVYEIVNTEPREQLYTYWRKER